MTLITDPRRLELAAKVLRDVAPTKSHDERHACFELAEELEERAGDLRRAVAAAR